MTRKNNSKLPFYELYKKRQKQKQKQKECSKDNLQAKIIKLPKLKTKNKKIFDTKVYHFDRRNQLVFIEDLLNNNYIDWARYNWLKQPFTRKDFIDMYFKGKIDFNCYFYPQKQTKNQPYKKPIDLIYLDSLIYFLEEKLEQKNKEIAKNASRSMQEYYRYGAYQQKTKNLGFTDKELQQFKSFLNATQNT